MFRYLWYSTVKLKFIIEIIEHCCWRAELKKCEEKYQSMGIDDEESVGNYFRIRQQLDTLGQELRSYILKPVYLLPFLQPGRLLRVGHPALVVQL
jgi:hypothetical protein